MEENSMILKRVVFLTAMIALIASSVYGFSPIVTVNTSTLTYDVTGALDMGNTSAIIKGTPAFAGVMSALKAGYNGGAWTGLELTSSVAAAHGTTYALAPMSVTDYQGLYGVNAGFYGPTAYPANYGTVAQPVFTQGVDNVSTLPAGSTLVKFTYAGDANLDGSVNTLDLSSIVGSVVFQNNGGTVADTYKNGDFNFDGSINTLDLSLVVGQVVFQNNNGPYAALALSSGDIAAVPEPSTIVLLLFGLASCVAFKKLWK
jgi:hypothetical protein